MGHEVDCIIERGQDLFPIEIKAGETITQDYFEALQYWNALAKADPAKSAVVYAGKKSVYIKEFQFLDGVLSKNFFRKFLRINNESFAYHSGILIESLSNYYSLLY